MFANALSPHSNNTPRSRELARDLRAKFGLDAVTFRGNALEKNAENVDAGMPSSSGKEKKMGNASTMVNTRDLPKSPLRDCTNSPLARSSSKEQQRMSMSANVNQWRSERAESTTAAGTSSSTAMTNTPTRLREVKTAATQTKDKKETKKDDVDVFGTRSMLAKSSNAPATAGNKKDASTATTKSTTTTTEKIFDDLVKREREVERVTEALNNVKDAELEMSRSDNKKHVDFAHALERQIEEKANKRLQEKEEELANVKITNEKAFETFTERIRQLENLVREKDVKIKTLEMNAQEWQALAKRDASRAELETLDMEKKLKELERKNEELNVVVSTLLGKATRGAALEKDMETIRLKQTTAKSVGTNTKAIPVAQPIQLQFTPETMKTPKGTVNASAQVDMKPPQAPTSVGTPLSAMRRKYQVQQNAMLAMQKEIEEREKQQQQQQQQQETITPKEPSPTIGFQWSAAYNAREMAMQSNNDEEVKAAEQDDEPTSSGGFDDDKQHWVPTPNTRKHVEEKYVGLQRQHPKEQSSFSNVIDPTTSRFASLTPVRVPQARQPIEHRATTHYARNAQESRKMYDDERMARLSRAMNLSDSPFRRRY